VQDDRDLACVGKRLTLQGRLSPTASRWKLNADELVFVDLSEGGWCHSAAWYIEDSEIVALST